MKSFYRRCRRELDDWIFVFRGPKRFTDNPLPPAIPPPSLPIQRPRPLSITDALSCTQEQSSFFSTLPKEIRLLIYEELLVNPGVIHIGWVSGKLLAVKCIEEYPHAPTFAHKCYRRWHILGNGSWHPSDVAHALQGFPSDSSPFFLASEFVTGMSANVCSLPSSLKTISSWRCC